MTDLLFYTGSHEVRFLATLPTAMISINVLNRRRSDFEANRWILDSGAFTRLLSGKGHLPIREYARAINRWAVCGDLQAAVAQDMMCEPFVLEITGLTVREHQSASTRNYLDLRDLVDTYVMPVVQGYAPEEYAEHTRELSPYLQEGSWVGVGTLCKRNGSPSTVSQVLTAVLRERPDLRIHGFGIKKTALSKADIRARMHSADSMAWSASARWLKTGRANDLSYAIEWSNEVRNLDVQPSQIGLGI